MKKILLFLAIIHLSCINCIQAQLSEVEDLCRKSSIQQSNMWWKNSIKTESPLIFEVQTNKYAFEFDYEKLTFNSFSIANTNTGVTNEPPRISFGIETYGKLYPCTHSSLRTEDCQLIHTGRFLQHRFINWIPELTGCDHILERPLNSFFTHYSNSDTTFQRYCCQILHPFHLYKTNFT